MSGHAIERWEERGCEGSGELSRIRIVDGGRGRFFDGVGQSFHSLVVHQRYQEDSQDDRTVDHPARDTLFPLLDAGCTWLVGCFGFREDSTAMLALLRRFKDHFPTISASFFHYQTR